MQIHDVQAFIAVVRNKSITKAAETLFISQTALTHRLKNLETELGVILLDRGHGMKEMTLTPSGEEFLRIAKRWSALWEETANFKAQGEQLILSIGAVHTLNEYIFPPLFTALMQHKPKIKLEIYSEHSGTLLTGVEQRRMDIAFTWKDIVHHNLVSVPWRTMPMVLLKCGKPQDANKIVIPNSSLDLGKEIFINWCPQYKMWHDRYWPTELYTSYMKILGAPVMMKLIKNTDLWSLVPLWLAKYAVSLGGFTYCRLSDPPDDITCFTTIHKYPRPSTEKALKIFMNLLNSFDF